MGAPLSRLNISLLCFRTLLGSTCNRVFWVGSLRIKQNHASFTVQFDPEPVCVTQHGKSGKSATSLCWSWTFQPNLFSSSPFVIGVDVLYPPLSLLLYSLAFYLWWFFQFILVKCCFQVSFNLKLILRMWRKLKWLSPFEKITRQLVNHVMSSRTETLSNLLLVLKLYVTKYYHGASFKQT